MLHTLEILPELLRQNRNIFTKFQWILFLQMLQKHYECPQMLVIIFLWKRCKCSAKSDIKTPLVAYEAYCKQFLRACAARSLWEKCLANFVPFFVCDTECYWLEWNTSDYGITYRMERWRRLTAAPLIPTSSVPWLQSNPVVSVWSGGPDPQLNFKSTHSGLVRRYLHVQCRQKGSLLLAVAASWLVNENSTWSRGWCQTVAVTGGTKYYEWLCALGWKMIARKRFPLGHVQGWGQFGLVRRWRQWHS